MFYDYFDIIAEHRTRINIMCSDTITYLFRIFSVVSHCIIVTCRYNACVLWLALRHYELTILWFSRAGHLKMLNNIGEFWMYTDLYKTKIYTTISKDFLTLHLQKNEGKAFLASQLKLTCLEDDDNLRNAIYVDFLYDNLMFTVEKGFTWRQVCTVVTFCDGILKDSKGILTVLTPCLSASTHVSFVSAWW